MITNSEGNIVVNTRILGAHLTGVQRYLLSILDNVPETIHCISPKKPVHGMQGHAWEQFILPFKVKNKLLWSPSTTGPLSVKKQVLTIHDLVPVDHPEFMNRYFAAWYQFLLPRIIHRVKHIIAISNFTKQRIIDIYGVPEEKIEVIWNGVDAKFTPKSPGEVSEVISKLAIPTKRYVVALGSLEPRKNLGRLLDAWSRIADSLPNDIWLVLAGAKGKSIVFEGVSLKSLPSRVFLTGHVPDQLLPALYAGAICAPYLSVYEGFGLPPLEAMACGTPALTGNITALAEVVGDAALTVNPYDVDAICEKLEQLIKDEALQQELRLRGFERVKKFQWKQTAQRTWDVLRKVAEE